MCSRVEFRESLPRSGVPLEDLRLQIVLAGVFGQRRSRLSQMQVRRAIKQGFAGLAALPAVLWF
jgi:hypothetical protein